MNNFIRNVHLWVLNVYGDWRYKNRTTLGYFRKWIKNWKLITEKNNSKLWIFFSWKYTSEKLNWIIQIIISFDWKMHSKMYILWYKLTSVIVITFCFFSCLLEAIIWTGVASPLLARPRLNVGFFHKVLLVSVLYNSGPSPLSLRCHLSILEGDNLFLETNWIYMWFMFMYETNFEWVH